MCVLQNTFLKTFLAFYLLCMSGQLRCRPPLHPPRSVVWEEGNFENRIMHVCIRWESNKPTRWYIRWTVACILGRWFYCGSQACQYTMTFYTGITLRNATVLVPSSMIHCRAVDIVSVDTNTLILLFEYIYIYINRICFEN